MRHIGTAQAFDTGFALERQRQTRQIGLSCRLTALPDSMGQRIHRSIEFHVFHKYW